MLMIYANDQKHADFFNAVKKTAVGIVKFYQAAIIEVSFSMFSKILFE